MAPMRAKVLSALAGRSFTPRHKKIQAGRKSKAQNKVGRGRQGPSPLHCNFGGTGQTLLCQNKQEDGMACQHALRKQLNLLANYSRKNQQINNCAQTKIILFSGTVDVLRHPNRSYQPMLLSRENGFIIWRSICRRPS